MTTPEGIHTISIAIPAEFNLAADALKDRVILITGAGQGLGRAAALAYAKAGATVILHGRNTKKLDAVYDEIVALGAPTPAIIPLDFLKATSAEFHQLAETIHATFKRLDAIFHAAVHIAPLAPLDAQDLATWQAHFTVNAAAPIALTRACMPMLKRAPSGRVIFVTETHAISPKPYWGAFAATKSLLAETAAMWADENDQAANLRFALLLPGPIATSSRSVTHPGETVGELRTPDAVVPSILFATSGDLPLGRASFIDASQAT